MQPLLAGHPAVPQRLADREGLIQQIETPQKQTPHLETDF